MNRSLCLVLAVVAFASGQALAEKPAAELVPLPGTPMEVQGFTLDPRVDCSVGELGSAWAAGDYIWGLEVYKQYCNTADCDPCPEGVENWLIDGITQVFQVGEEDVPCTLWVHADIEEVDWTDPGCPVPGDVIWSSPTYEVIVYQAGAWHAPISGEGCPPVNGDFFAGYYWDRLHPEGRRPDLVLADLPCTPCWSYNDYGYGWEDICDLGAGNVTLWVNLNCNIVNPVAEKTWATVKALYTD